MPDHTINSDSHTMQCMEVWGGFGLTNNGVTMPGLDVWVLAKPYAGDEVGGDVHYVSSCGTGRISRLLVADVSGHGVKVAQVASSLRTLMRRYVNYINQQAFVEKMNTEFTDLVRNGMFATAAVVTYFAPTGTLSVTNAGHPRPLLFSAKRRAWRLLKEDPAASSGQAMSNLPLGMFPETVYPAVDLRAKTGDLCVVYSDSLLEAETSPGVLLGEQGLLKIAETLNITRPDRVGQELFEKVLASTNLSALNDDVTVLVLRPNGLRMAAPIHQRLWASIRFLGTVVRSLFAPKNNPVPWPEASRANILGVFARSATQSHGQRAHEL